MTTSTLADQCMSCDRLCPIITIWDHTRILRLEQGDRDCRFIMVEHGAHADTDFNRIYLNDCDGHCGN